MKRNCVFLSLAIVVMAGCSQQNPVRPEPTTSPGSTTASRPGSLALHAPEPAGRPMSASLSGAEEVPGPGDPDGSGAASLTLNLGQGEICFEINVSNIDLPAIGAHIHVGPAGVAGPVVVPLTPPGAGGLSSGCVSVQADLVKAIRQDPARYYVNVHTTPFPAGAVRGQISK